MLHRVSVRHRMLRAGRLTRKNKLGQRDVLRHSRRRQLLHAGKLRHKPASVLNLPHSAFNSPRPRDVFLFGANVADRQMQHVATFNLVCDKNTSPVALTALSTRSFNSFHFSSGTPAWTGAEVHRAEGHRRDHLPARCGAHPAFEPCANANVLANPLDDAIHAEGSAR